MRYLRLSFLFLLAVLFGCKSATTNSDKAEKNGWHLSMQTWTLSHFPLTEAINKTQLLHLKYAEVYPGETLGEGFQGNMDPSMDKATQQKVLGYAKSKGVKIVAMGVAVCKDTVEWKQLFDFAKSIGIEVITCEPTPEQLDYVEKMADLYQIDIAIHNHPKPSTYWQPDTFLSLVKGRSQRIGACADVGHWTRMGINPIEALKKCEGRIKVLHFKDVQKSEPESTDVIWGTGVCNVEGMLAELKRQNFKGIFSIEYETNWDNSVPDIEKCIDYFNGCAGKLFQ